MSVVVGVVVMVVVVVVVASAMICCFVGDVVVVVVAVAVVVVLVIVVAVVFVPLPSVSAGRSQTVEVRTDSITNIARRFFIPTLWHNIFSYVGAKVFVVCIRFFFSVVYSPPLIAAQFASFLTRAANYIYIYVMYTEMIDVHIF